jgi:hypothetical protein
MRKAAWAVAVLAVMASVGPESAAAADAKLWQVNVIDGADERDSLLKLAPQLGLSAEEITRIRRASGYVGCFLPSPSVGTGALFLTDRQIITAGHILYDRAGHRRSKCFFKNQDADAPVLIDLLVDDGDVAVGRVPPRAGSNDDFAIVRLAAPVPGAEPFPVRPDVPVMAGDRLIVITAHPAGMARDVDNAVPVAQACQVRRVPVSTAKTSFYRTDCDATGSSSGGMQLARVDGVLTFRGVTITTGPWQEERFDGAPYDERAGSVTTALGTDAAVLAAGRRLAAGAR